VVISARGRNPRLAGPVEIEQPLGAVYSLFAAVEAAGLEQRSVVRTLDIRADGVMAARLGLEESTPLVHVERLRLAGGEPLALDRVWLPADLARPLLDADLSHTALYAELEERCGVRLTGGQEHIRAIAPSLAEARLLDLGPGTAALAIDRLGARAGTPLEWRHTVVRGDRFAVVAEFSAGGYRLDLAAPPLTRLQAV
jgi:GntR family transcriptional regulator